jgi:curli biogenesis system outer membrane secretion channel CsgG
MRSFLKYAAAVVALTAAVPAFAQTAPAPAPAAQADSPAPPADSPAPPAAVSVGQSVKDSTGATIGTVSEVKPDATGTKQMATIKMGEETFAVDTTALAVRDGVVLINATQAEIKAMMKK